MRGLIHCWVRILLGAFFALTPAETSAVNLADILLVNQARSRAVSGDLAGAISIIETEIGNAKDRPAEEVIALLEFLAGLLWRAERFTEAAKTYQKVAEHMALRDGEMAPGLAIAYEQAGLAFQRAGDLLSAADFFTRSLDLDRRYLFCDSDMITLSLSRLADLKDALGEHEEARHLRKLADDGDKRCNDAEFSEQSREIVIEAGIPEASQESFSSVPVFYATDRDRSGSNRPDSFYGNNRGSLEFGVLNITVPRIHKPGAVEAPSILLLEWKQNPERHIVITKLETLGEDEAFLRMRLTLDSNNTDEVFVFVHGYNVTFADAAKRTAQIAYDLNFDGIAFLYSWPSLGSPFGYLADENVVELGGRRLLTILDKLSSQTGVERIHLIAHSMGNRALAGALELMAMRGQARLNPEPRFEQVLFAAPDIDIDLFAEMVRMIRPLARRITLYVSGRDAALATSRSLHGEQTRAGEAGSRVLVSDYLDTVDMTALGGDMLGHSYFASDASALSDILWLFWRDDAPSKRCGMKTGSTGKKTHWRYDPEACDGDAALSALTLLRMHGEGALDLAMYRLGQIPDDAAAAKREWQSIADAVRAALGL